ncbi:MAG TPA: DUF456 domain-containing protein [Kiritimatiellia bacterium]|nr:DUF456 domain-containing protein [Kiritimatiellia bacterium]
MTATLLHGLAAAGVFLAWAVCALLCATGLLLAMFSISGTWLVLAAGIVAALLTGSAEFPGWPTLLGMLVVCVAVDTGEWFAVRWGVQRRGGSRAAGWLALLGSVGGAVAGGLVVPIIGNLIGMLLGCFLPVFFYEQHRLKKADGAARIANGAVLAGLIVLLQKVAATTGMVLWLAAGLLF